MCYKKCIVLPAFRQLCAVRVTYHLSPGLPGSRGGLGGPELRGWGTGPATPLWYRFISPGKGTAVHSTTCSPRKGKREPAPGEFGGPAGESRVQVLSWLLTVQGCARAENGPGCLQTLPARAGLVPLLQLLQLSSQQVRAACSVLPWQDQTSP